MTTVPATLPLQTNRFYESPATEDATPTARLLFRTTRNCPDGTRFGWGGTVPAAITSTENLKSLTAEGTGRVRDVFGVFHDVTFNVAWTGVGEVQTSTSPIQRTLVGTSVEKERPATATGQVMFDGALVVDGDANDPVNTPFIRTTEERYAEPPN